MSGFEFELDTATETLRAARLKMREYFLSCEPDKRTPKDWWYNMFNDNITKALKRQALDFGFGAGGTPGWFVDAFAIFSEVLAAELEHGKLMSRKFNPPEFGVKDE